MSTSVAFDGVSAAIGLASLIVAIAADVRSRRAEEHARRSDERAMRLEERAFKLECRTKVGEAFAESLAGRRAMEFIVGLGEPKLGKPQGDWNAEDDAAFRKFYNAQYHSAVIGTRERALSESIYAYLNHINQLWVDVKADALGPDDVLDIFGDSVSMDSRLIELYLRAHKEAHEGKCFWELVPEVVERSIAWRSDRGGAEGETGPSLNSNQ